MTRSESLGQYMLEDQRIEYTIDQDRCVAIDWHQLVDTSKYQLCRMMYKTGLLKSTPSLEEYQAPDKAEVLDEGNTHHSLDTTWMLTVLRWEHSNHRMEGYSRIQPR